MRAKRRLLKFIEATILKAARLTVRIPPIRWLLLKCYVAAYDEAGALDMAWKLRKTGYGVISNILGESAESDAARRFAERYVVHIKKLSILKACDAKSGIAISVKPSQLGMGRDKNLALELALGILNECVKHDIGFEVDMEGPETIDDTAEFVEKLADGTEERGHPIIRVAIQANAVQENRSASKDLILRLAGRKGKIGVRIVKGAYLGGYFKKDRLIKIQFAKLAVLAAENHMNVALGTHDVELANKIKISVPQATVQMLFGVRPFAKKDYIYMCWGEKKDAERYLERRMQEGARLNVLLLFALNIVEAVIWRIKMRLVKNTK